MEEPFETEEKMHAFNELSNEDLRIKQPITGTPSPTKIDAQEADRFSKSHDLKVVKGKSQLDNSFTPS